VGKKGEEKERKSEKRRRKERAESIKMIFFRLSQQLKETDWQEKWATNSWKPVRSVARMWKLLSR
jgi:hypothetical protein